MTIAFITTSMHTDIQNTQSALIKKHFPDSPHVLMDGRNIPGSFYPVPHGPFDKKDSWYGWVVTAKELNCDYTVYIDEDCFLLDSKPLLELIEKMKAGNYHIAGTRDGGNEMRENNPFSMNCFFLVVTREALEIPTENLFYKDEYSDGENPANYIKKLAMGGNINCSYNHNQEPYYDYVWNLKRLKRNFLYLDCTYDPDLSTTNLLENTVVHAWFMRLRNYDRIVCHIHNYTNKERFDRIIKKVTS